MAKKAPKTSALSYLLVGAGTVAGGVILVGMFASLWFGASAKAQGSVQGFRRG